MSYNRLRRLAGLNESFTDNERMNHEIEDLIAQQQPGTHHRWSDLLEVIYGAGRHGSAARRSKPGSNTCTAG